MTIQYELNENDFLTFQLYTASKSEQIIKKRKRTKVRVPIAYIVMGFLLFLINEYVMAIIFGVIAIAWFLFYPFWEKHRYLNHYKAFIKENYKDRLGRVGTLEISNDVVIAKENGSESRLLTVEVDGIIEISTLIFIRIKGGQAFIVPKDRISNTNALVARLKDLAAYLNINYSIEDKWKWK